MSTLALQSGEALAWTERQRLCAWTEPIGCSNPFALLRLAAHVPRAFWRDPASGLTLVGLGAAALLRADGPMRVARLQLQIDHLFDGATIESASGNEARPRLIGGMAFSTSTVSDGLWKPFGSACFVLPHILITMTSNWAWLTVCRNVDAASSPEATMASLRDEAEALRAGLETMPVDVAATESEKVPASPIVTHDEWYAMVTGAVDEIHQGRLQKVVLSRALDAQGHEPLDPIVGLSRLDAQYPDTFRFLFEPDGQTAFFGATPEVLSRVEEAVLTTMALAGSRPRGMTLENDAALAAELLASAKEREEHRIVVESMRMRIAPFARSVRASEEPGILRLRNIQHLHTPIEAELETHFDALDLVAELHPTPALGGFPARAALAAIEALEPFERGWFAAPIGWIDARGDGVFAVAIRSAIVHGARGRLYAGAGIVADSQPDQEWDETRLKFRPLLGALGATEAE